MQIRVHPLVLFALPKMTCSTPWKTAYVGNEGEPNNSCSRRRFLSGAGVLSESHVGVFYSVAVFRRVRDCHVAEVIDMEEKRAGSDGEIKGTPNSISQH
jgi:hypothetical protein